MLEKQSKVSYIVSEIKWRINSGVYQINEKIPSENAFASSFGVSRITTRKALQMLVESDYIVPKKNIGYFVCKLKETMQPKEGLLDEMIVKKIDMSIITTSQQDALSKVHPGYKKIIHDFEFITIKKYYINENVFHLKLILFNTKIIKNITEDDVKHGVSEFYFRNRIKIVKRHEVNYMASPSKFIIDEMKLENKNLIPVAVAKLIDSNENIVELVIEYFLPQEFEIKRTINY